MLEQQDHREMLEQLDHRAYREMLAQPVHPGFKVPQDLKELLELLGLVVYRAPSGLLAHLAHKET
jgi:hypothetical protein